MIQELKKPRSNMHAARPQLFRIYVKQKIENIRGGPLAPPLIPSMHEHILRSSSVIQNKIYVLNNEKTS